MATVIQINNFIQAKLEELGQEEISAVEMAHHLHQTGILNDNETRPGLPLRNYLRDGKIIGGFQYENKRWVIRRTKSEEMLSIKEAAIHLGITEQTLYKRIERDQIRTERIGNRVVVPMSEVLKKDSNNSFSFDALGNGIVGLRIEAEKFLEKINLIENLFNRLMYPDKFQQQGYLKNLFNNLEVSMENAVLEKVTLHEEIELILKEAGKALTTSQIADLVNKRQNYKKKDGSQVSPFQIHGRTKNYSNLFIRNGSMVSLRNVEDNRPETNAPTKDINGLVNYNFSEDDVTHNDFLVKMGFVIIGTIKSILENGLPDIESLSSSGLYAITKPKDYQPDYIYNNEIKNVLSPWEVERLKEKWVGDTDILYYGVAGSQSPRSLRMRLNDLIKHCCGQTSNNGPHKGGEIIWQLNGYDNFEIWILPVAFSENPRLMEELILRRFHTIKNKLPFANRQF